MPYTLAKWIVWLLLAALVGGVIGYLLRGLRGDRSRQADAAPQRAAGSGAPSADAEELAQLRIEAAQRDAQYDQVKNERDQLLADRERLRGDLADCRAEVSAAAASTDPSVAAGASGADIRGFAAVAPEAPAEAVEPAEPVEPELTDDDLAAGAALIGRRLRPDDLTVVEGIGPKIAELLQASGITTWSGLAGSSVAALRSTLDEGGPTFRIHDPGTWPEQASLLVGGRWAEFKELTDRLDGGRA